MTWNRAALHVFSGTGNTLRVARSLEGVFEEAGIRVVRMRMGVVLDTRGGMLPLVSLATRFGLGGILGTIGVGLGFAFFKDVTSHRKSQRLDPAIVIHVKEKTGL